jgi:putative ABC transport system permease protein
MLRTALRTVFAHKARLLMTTLAVMLGVAFVSGTLVFTDSVSDAQRASATQGFEGVDVAVRPEPAEGDDRLRETPELTEKVRRPGSPPAPAAPARPSATASGPRAATSGAPTTRATR